MSYINNDKINSQRLIYMLEIENEMLRNKVKKLLYENEEQRITIESIRQKTTNDELLGSTITQKKENDTERTTR